MISAMHWSDPSWGSRLHGQGNLRPQSHINPSASSVKPRSASWPFKTIYQYSQALILFEFLVLAYCLSFIRFPIFMCLAYIYCRSPTPTTLNYKPTSQRQPQLLKAEALYYSDWPHQGNRWTPNHEPPLVYCWCYKKSCIGYSFQDPICYSMWTPCYYNNRMYTPSPIGYGFLETSTAPIIILHWSSNLIIVGATCVWASQYKPKALGMLAWFWGS